MKFMKKNLKNLQIMINIQIKIKKHKLLNLLAKILKLKKNFYLVKDYKFQIGVNNLIYFLIFLFNN